MQFPWDSLRLQFQLLEQPLALYHRHTLCKDKCQDSINQFMAKMFRLNRMLQYKDSLSQFMAKMFRLNPMLQYKDSLSQFMAKMFRLNPMLQYKDRISQFMAKMFRLNLMLQYKDSLSQFMAKMFRLNPMRDSQSMPKRRRTGNRKALRNLIRLDSPLRT